MTYGIYKIYYTKSNGEEVLLGYTDSQKEAQTFRKNGYKVITSIKAFEMSENSFTSIDIGRK